MADNDDTQTVTFAVNAINEMAASTDPGALTISTATAGSQPDNATDATTTYAITTNADSSAPKKITGAIESVMPTAVTLTVNLAAPSVGSSAGATALSTSAADLVTGISKVAESGRTITYTLSATVAAGVVASATRTVTLTLTDS